MAEPATRQAIAKRLARVAVDEILGAAPDDLSQRLRLTAPLRREPVPRFLTFSGGVAEYMFEREQRAYGDIAMLLARELVSEINARVAMPVLEPAERIRATVIGASQFTVQVSGKTIYLPDPAVLPVHNLPVVHLGGPVPEVIDAPGIAAAFTGSAGRLDLEAGTALALAFSWSGLPEYGRLLAMARGIAAFVAPRRMAGAMLCLMIDGDVGSSLGRILHRELRLDCKIVSVDGIKLQELDFVDVGAWLDPPGVVPVVIKSLLFS